MFIEDRVAAVKAGWRRLVDVESREHGLAMLGLLTLQYHPRDLCLGIGMVHELAWYAHDVPALVTTLTSEVAVFTGAVLAPALLGCLT